MICPICIIYLKCCHIGGGCLEHKIVYLALRPLFLEISVTRDRSSSSTVYSSGAGLGVPGPAAATGEGAARAPAPADTTPTPPPPPPPQLRTAAGRGSKAWVEGCATAAAHLERTAPPPPTLPERGGGIQGRRSRRGQSLHSLGVPPSFEQWEVRAVLYLSRHARATEMWPARAENRARVNTRSRTASFARRAVHHFLAARIVQREES